MLEAIFQAYLEGLFFAFIICFTLVLLWLLSRIIRRKDKTALEKQRRLFEGVLILLIVTPVLSFAVLAILVMIRA